MQNKKIFLTLGFSPLLLLTRGQAHLLLIVLLLFLSNLPGRAYWHHVYDYDKWSNVVYNVVGDSSALYADIELNDKGKIIKSTDMGKTWDVIYDEWRDYKDYISFSPYRTLTGMKYSGGNYLFLLYSGYDDYVPEGQYKAGTGIKRFDLRLGKVVDSIALELEVGQTKNRAFFMYDSLNGLVYNSWFLSITRDAWKTCTTLDLRDCVYDEEKKEYSGLSQGMTAPIMLSPDTVFCLSASSGPPSYYSFFLAIIGKGDTTFTFEPLGENLNIEISKDSIHQITDSSQIFYKRASNFAYINDSTWLYTAPGRKTGYGQCKTLEIFKTENRGETFRQVCLMDINAFGLYDIKFKDSQNGIAIGNDVSLFTNDCGETWKVDTKVYDFDWSVFNQPFWGVRISYVDNMTFMTTWNSGIYKYEDSLGTADTTGVIERNIFNRNFIYPNPVQAGQTLNFKIPQLISGRAFIYDIYGNKVDEINFFGNSIQLRNDIIAGTYFLVIGDMNEKIIMRSKFIVK